MLLYIFLYWIAKTFLQQIEYYDEYLLFRALDSVVFESKLELPLRSL